MARWFIAVAAATALALLALPLALSAPSRAAGCASGYRYSGFGQSSGARIAATVTPLAPPRVRSGHVAAWVGVGDRRSWLQVGVAAFPGRPLRLYYELRAPGAPRRYVELPGRIRTGAPRRLAVEELGGDWWVARVDGRTVAAAYLPGSAPGLPLVATGETWSDGRAGCNAFRFRFRDAALAAATRLGAPIGMPSRFVAAGA